MAETLSPFRKGALPLLDEVDSVIGGHGVVGRFDKLHGNASDEVLGHGARMRWPWKGRFAVCDEGRVMGRMAGVQGTRSRASLDCEMAFFVESWRPCITQLGSE